jgi:hypothetical protein
VGAGDLEHGEVGVPLDAPGVLDAAAARRQTRDDRLERFAGEGFGHRLARVHVGEAHLGATQTLANLSLIERAADARALADEAEHLVFPRDQLTHDMLADVPRGSDDEHLHATHPSTQMLRFSHDPVMCERGRR